MRSRPGQNDIGTIGLHGPGGGNPQFLGRRAAFTLTELIVSIGVMGLMMTMAGAVFHLTIKSTGQAKAVVSVAQRLRAFENSLRADLSGITPESSILVIVPAKMNAYWTTAGRDADDNGDPFDGYPHPEDPEREVHVGGVHVLAKPRADRLMFVTARSNASVVDPSISGGIQIVTYGHAILGEWRDEDPDPDDYDWQWRPQYGESGNERRARFDNAMLIAGIHQTGARNIFPTPAQSWHLSRRGVLLVEYDPNNIPSQFDEDDANYSPAVATTPSDCVPDDPEKDPYTCTVEAEYELGLTTGRQDVVAYPTDGTGVFHFDDIVYNLVHHPSYNGVEYRLDWYARSELDLTPPAPIAERLGHYLLPNCASFRVEFALDLPELHGLGEVLWIDPGDLVAPTGSVKAWNDDDLPEEDWSPTRVRLERLLKRIEDAEEDGKTSPRYKDMEDLFKDKGAKGKFTPPDTPTPENRNHLRFKVNLLNDEPMARWYTTGPESSVIREADPFFPVALRVTVDVYDDEKRLERPTRHMMVFKIGS